MSNECYSILSGRPLTLHEHPHPAAHGSWGVPLYTADYGLGIESETSRLMAQRSHVGDVFSSQMCVYIPQNIPKPPRN
jgi:hypothetical protein